MFLPKIASSNIRGKLVSFNLFAITFVMQGKYFVNYFITKQGCEEWL